MNEEAFNTMYILAQKEGYKKTPEEFKTLLSSNQEALNTMYSIAQREGYKKTPEEFKTLLGVSGVEGKPVNFTEGSGEQQEQPTEPLEKPIVDKVNLNPYTVTTTSLAGRNIEKPKTTYDDSFRGKFKQLLDEEVEKIDDNKIVSQEEQSDILSKLTKRAEQIEVERAGIEVSEDALFEKTSAQKALDELLVKEFPIDVISEGGRNVSPTIENLEKLKKLDPAFSDYVYNKALKQKNFFDKLEKGQVTERDKYKIMADFNSLKLQDSYDNLQITINENNKIVEDIDKSIEQQKNEMLSTPYFVLDEDGKFSAGIIKTPEQRAEAQSMYNKLSSLIDDKNAQSTSPQYSKNYIDFLNASAKQDALESGEYKDIHKKLKENEIYKEELLDGSWASFGKDLTARLVNGASSFVANSVAFPASMASSYRSLIGADYKYGISDMVVDWAESTSEPFNASERKFTMKDPFTGETKYDAGGLVLSGVDQLGLLFGLAFGNKYSSIKAANKLSKAGITGKRASDAMKISQRWNTFLTGTMASHAQNLRESREMGLSGADLFAYTTFMSTLEGTSELVFPNQNILGKDLKGIALKTFVKNLGKGRKLALKASLNEVLTAMGSEAAEEYIVLLGKMTQTALISINNEEINTYIPEFEEVIETGAVASLVGGGSTSVIQGYQNITGAKRKEVMSYAISKGTEVDFNGLKTAVAQQVEKENISQYDADSYLLNVHLANNYAKYIPDEIKGKTRQELLPIAQELDSLIKQSKEKEGVAKKALQERIKVLEGYMESKIKGEAMTQTPSYDKPTVFTTPTSERYGTVNRQDGKGDVVLTEEEYNAEMEIFTPVEEVAPTEEVSETVREDVAVEDKQEAEEKERGFFGKLPDKVFKKEKIEEDVQLTEEQKEQSIQSLYNEEAEYYERKIKQYQEEGNVVLENSYKSGLDKLKSQSPKQFLEEEIESLKRMAENYSKDEVYEFEIRIAQESLDKIYQIEKLLGVTATEQEVKERQDIRAELEAKQQTLKPDQDAIQEPSTEAVEEDVTAEFTPTEEVSETVETISPLSERLKNVRVERVGDTFDKGARGEAINEKEIEEAQSVLMDELNEIEKSNLPQEQKDAASAEVEKLFNELENYELTTETKTRKITQKRPTRVVREGVKEQTKSPQERSVGRKINIVEGTEFTQEGFVPQEGETIVLEEQDGKIVLQAFDKDGNKTKSQELELESVNDLELVETLKDDDGRVIGATVRNKNNDAEVFSIMDEELALDYAIEKTKAEVGEMSIEEESVFEEYEEVKKRPTKKELTKEVVEDDSDKIFEQKKSEIESRRQAELEANSRFTGEKVIVDQINAKYDAELSRLEAQESQKEESKKAEEKTTDTTTDTQETTEGAETTTELTEEQVSELNKFLGIDKSKRKASRKGITKKDNQRLDKVERAVDLLEQSLSEVMPNIVISVAEDSDMFARFAGEQEEKKEDRSKGLFTRVDGKYVIVLNPDSADVTTVFHEGLHAVLVAAGLPSTMARAVTARMVEAVKKTATKKLQKELEAFTDLYKTPLQSEEYIAELIGILANNYNEQNNETKSIIRRWLQKLAEMLGLKPKGVSLSTVGLNNTDAATIDALNFVAKKMSEGGVLTEQDLTRLVQPGEEQQGDGGEETVTRKQRRKKPKSKVKDAFEWGIQNGVPAIAVKNHLIKLGYTEEEIDEATPVKSKPKESIKKLINKVSRLTDNNEARAIVAKELRELLKDSKLSQFSKRTINKVITSLKNTNVSNMQKMLDKVDDAISNDEGRAERIKRYKNRSIAIKRIAKIGPLKELQDPFIRMMGIDPKYLSKETQKEYDSVLSDILNINKKYDKTSRDAFKAKIDLVLDSYDIDSVRAKEIADRINELIDPNKTLNTNLARLEKNKKITKEERELITRFKSLLDESSVADPMAGYTEEEIEEYKGMLEAEKREGIEEDFIETLSQPQSAFYSADDTGAFKLSEEERRYVKEANSITLKDIQELSLRDAKSVVRALEAMKAGFLTPELFQGVIKVRGVRGNMSIPLNEIKESGFIDKISSKISSSILNIGRKKKITGIGDRLRSAPTKNYEQILKVEKELLSDGSKRFKATNIYKSLFKPTSTAFSKSDQTLTEIEDKLKNATALLSRNQNERFIQKAKVMVFQIQREYDSNIGKGNKEVNQAKDWINATIKDKDTALNERDIRELEKIRDGYLTDGQVDAKKLYDSLTENEKKFLEIIDGVYDELTFMARMDAAVQGMPFIHRENYIHLPKSGTKTSEISNDFEPLFDSFMNASVKNKAAIQRTGKTHSISFDPVSNAYSASRKIVVGYHMYPVIKSTRIAFSGLKNRAETRFEKDLVNELESIYDRIINSQYKNVTKNKILADNIFRYLTKAGYFSQLSGVVKAASEFGTNTLHAVMNHAGGLVDGYATLVSVDTKTIDKALENTDTTQMDRLTKTAKFDNKDIEGKLLSKAKLFNPEQMTGELAASAKTVGKVAAMPFQTVFKLNESLITKPDEMVIRPLFVGEFQNKFKQLTGQKLNWEKLANDESYRDRFQEAINQASEQADSAVIDTSASTNPFDTIPSNISDPDASDWKKAFQVINRYMSNFRVFEYYSAVKGVQNLLGKGEISRGAGMMLLASTIMRMSIYRLGIDYAFGLIFSMLGMDEDEDEIKKEDLTRSVLSGIVTLAFGRNLGNLTQSVVNLGIEFANMEFGEGITWDSVTKDGEKTEYDPYKDSMVFSKIPVKRSPGRDLFTDFLISSAGPLTPTIKSVRRATTLTDRSIYNNTKESRDKNKNELFFKTPFDIAGSLGFIPNYKELKKINDRYWFGGNRDTEKKTTEKKTKGKILGRTRTQSSRTSSTGRKAPRSNRTR
jgi:hypothetical protein